MLHAIPSNLQQGTVTFSASDPAAVRFFDDNGQQINNLSMDLSSPSGPLAGLMGGDVNFWVQGMQSSADETLTYAYSDSQSNQSASTTIHITVANWTFVDTNGQSVNSVDKDAEQLLQDDVTADPNAPQAADSVYYKVRIDGLPTSDVTSLTVQSDSVSTDSYTDDFSSSENATESSDFGVLYTQPDGGDDLTSTQISDMKDMYHLNVVHNPKGDATVATTQDSFTRHLVGNAQGDAQTIRDLLLQGSYAGETQFVLDRMDWKHDGTDWANRLVFQRMLLSNHAEESGIIYVDPRGSAQEQASWALNGIREWAGEGVRGLQPGHSYQYDYFAQIARLYAKSFYYTGANFDQTPTNPDSNAAVDSLGRTLDFLYFFSKGPSGDTGSQMYPATPTHSGAGNQVSVPLIYMWIFSNRTDLFVNQPTVAEVNIPCRLGMDRSYWEADRTGHNQDTGFDAATGTWPDDDQNHHFAAYFYLGSEAYYNDTDLLLTMALKRTGDYHDPVKGMWNPGDYYLGILGADLGHEWSFDQGAGYQGNRVISLLQSPWAAAFAKTGRGNNLP